jgi:hypothetical protein
MKPIRLLILLLFISIKSLADEGMWLPFLLENLNEKEMKAMGMKISAKDIYDINKGSLKDAIVQFGGGCTGEVISNEGLVLTNHHCGFGSIQRLSTLTNNYIANGYWSNNKTEELACPGLSVTFISKMEDITKMVLSGVTNDLPEQERQSLIDKNIKAFQGTYKKESYENLLVRPFYNGNMYCAIVTVVYTDIRFAGAPPESIGAYGHDTDNWVWPRHAADFSVFRIYAGAHNKPAVYSADNVPFKPKKSLNISLKGVKEGDFTMVFGFPGRTNEYLPAIAVKQTLEINNPIKIQIRDAVLKVQKSFMEKDEAIKLQYSSKYAGIANSWKKWIGENLGLARSNAVQKKLDQEKVFTDKVNSNPEWKMEYGNILDQLNTLYQTGENYFYLRDVYAETTGNSEILSQALQLNNLEKLLVAGDEAAINKEKNNILSRMTAFYKDYNARVDEAVLEKLLQVYFTHVDKKFWGLATKKIWNPVHGDAAVLVKSIFPGSFLTSETQFKTTMALPASELLIALRTDKACQLAIALKSDYMAYSAGFLDAVQPEINKWQRNYMAAQMEVLKSKRFYPDANSTLRLSYGKVKGYEPRDGTFFHYYTYLDGVMEKYIPGDYEFDVPQKLRDLYAAKDYGKYGEKGKMPVCFIAANHTTGGNSGSPALDAYGNLVGLNFDRAWEGTMSDINYDPNICRNIMVDLRYVLFIIDKFGGATHLIKEMNLVYPKK